MKLSKSMSRLFSLLLAVIMIVGMLPLSVFADEGDVTYKEIQASEITKDMEILIVGVSGNKTVAVANKEGDKPDQTTVTIDDDRTITLKKTDAEKLLWTVSDNTVRAGSQSSTQQYGFSLYNETENEGSFIYRVTTNNDITFGNPIPTDGDDKDRYGHVVRNGFIGNYNGKQKFYGLTYNGSKFIYVQDIETSTRAKSIFFFVEDTSCNDAETSWEHVENTKTHIAKCDACGEDVGTAVNCDTSTATCVAKETCSDCNAVYGDFAAHTPSGEYERVAGQEAHKELCEVCEEPFGEAEACGGDTATCEEKAVCSDCNEVYGDFAAHTPSGEYDRVAGQEAHKELCDVCEEPFGEAEACGGGTATCMAKAVCSDCGEEYGNKSNEHEWEEEYTQENDKHYKECTVTGCTVTTEKVDHDYGTTGTCVCGAEEPQHDCDFTGAEWVSDGTQHWRVCVEDGCELTSEKTYCSGGTATCEEKAECSVCENEYGDFAAHTPSGEYDRVAGQEAHKELCDVCEEPFGEAEACGGGTATCEEKAVCSDCNAVYGDFAAHTPSGEYERVAGQEAHKELCDVCEEPFGEAEACGGGTATCEAKAVCSDCNEVYGDFAAHTPSGEYERVAGQEAHKELCDVCEEPFGEAEACGGGTATCMAKAVCSDCGEEYGNKSNEHKWAEEYTQENDKHYKECTVTGCTVTTEKVDHDYGTTGTCVCGKTQPAAGQTVTYTKIDASAITANDKIIIVGKSDNKTVALGKNGQEVNVTVSGNTVTVSNASDVANVVWTVGNSNPSQANGQSKSFTFNISGSYLARKSGSGYTNDFEIKTSGLDNKYIGHYVEAGTFGNDSGSVTPPFYGLAYTSNGFKYVNSNDDTYNTVVGNMSFYKEVAVADDDDDDTIAVTGVTLTPATLTLTAGTTGSLTATVAPTNATNQAVTWTSSNTAVATVANGTVTAVAPGSATITVTTADGSFTDTCAVTVSAATVAVTGVTLTPETLALTVGGTGTLTATVAPSNANNQNVTWTSSNTSVATVANGTVTAVAAGTATITVTTADGSFTDTCVVTVNAAQPPVEEEPAYEQIDAADIEIGDKIVIVGKSGNNYYALTNGSNQKTAVTVSGDEVTVTGSADALIWTVGEATGNQVDTANGNDLDYVFSNGSTYFGRVTETNVVEFATGTAANTKYFGHDVQDGTIGNFSRTMDPPYYGLLYQNDQFIYVNGANNTSNASVLFFKAINVEDDGGDVDPNPDPGPGTDPNPNPGPGTEPEDESYSKVELADLVTDEYVIVINNQFALTNTTGAQSGTPSNDNNAYAGLASKAVTISGNYITGDVDANMIWDVTVQGGKLTIQDESGNYLTADYGGTGHNNLRTLKVGTAVDNNWAYTLQNNKTVLNNTAQNTSQSGNDNGCYLYLTTGTNTNTVSVRSQGSNYTNAATVTFYKVGAGEVNPNPTPTPTPGTGSNIGFTSDVHSQTGNLQNWLNGVQNAVDPNLEHMAFGGDFTNEDTIAVFNNVVSMVNTTVGNNTGIYTTGNHEYDNDSLVSQMSNTAGFKRIGEAVDEDNYNIYCIGAHTGDGTGSYTEADIATLGAYLDSAPTEEPVFIVAHYPLHYISSRTISNADKMIDELNGHPNVIFIWGHNHSQGDGKYGTIVTANGSIEYARGSNKTINFTYANAGAMNGDRSPYYGMVANVAANGSTVTMTYYNTSGAAVTTPVTVVIAEGDHTHTLSRVAAKESTCSVAGNVEHWHCSGCGKNYTSEAATSEIANVATELKDHDVVVQLAVEATCSTTGLTAGSYCSVCETVIEEQEVVEKKPHTSVTDPAIAATCTETGLTEGSHCSVCGEVIAAQTTVEKKAHDFGQNNVNPTCSVCGAVNPNTPDAGAKFNIYGTNMTLGNNLFINFFVHSANLNADETHYAVLTKSYADGTPNLTMKIEQKDWKKNEDNPSLLYFSLGVTAKEMSDTINVVVYNSKDEAVSNVYNESVRTYTMRALEKEEAKENVNKNKLALYVDMLNYGAAAQVRFGYNEADLANKLLSTEQKAYGATSVSVTDKRVSGTGYVGTNLTLDVNILMNFFFNNIPDSHNDMYAIASFTNHYGEYVEVKIAGKDFCQLDNDTRWYIPVSEIVVADYDRLVTVHVYDANGTSIASATDSLESYIARAMSKDPALYEAIMKFAVSAKAALH